MSEEQAGRLSFLRWGLRYYSVLFFLGYPILGAFFSLPDFSIKNLIKLIFFGFFNLLFLFQVFMFNDWGDYQFNPDEAQRRSRQALKHPELVSERQILALCIILALISILGIFALSLNSAAVVIVVYLINLFYSHPRLSLKKMPALAELAHLLGGGLYFLSGWLLFEKPSGFSLLLAGFFGTILMAGNFPNQIEHFEEELKSGLRTSAIAFGKRQVHNFSLWLFVLSSVYLFAVMIFHSKNPFFIGSGIFLIISWLGVIFSARNDLFLKNISKLRQIIRIIYAIFSLILIFGIFWEKLR